MKKIIERILIVLESLPSLSLTERNEICEIKSDLASLKSETVDKPKRAAKAKRAKKVKLPTLPFAPEMLPAPASEPTPSPAPAIEETPP